MQVEMTTEKRSEPMSRMISERASQVASTLSESMEGMTRGQRIGLGVFGGILALRGLRRIGLIGPLMAIGGAALAYRALTNENPVEVVRGSARLRQMTGAPTQEGVFVTEAVTINRPVEELYAFWRNAENLPKVVPQVISVTDLGNRRYRWTVRGPLGSTFSWDSEIYDEVPNERLSWRSLPGAQAPNEGVVEFKKLPGKRGTVVQVDMHYIPPGGALGKWLVSRTAGDPMLWLREGLRRVKQQMEAGETPTTAGQPSGRMAMRQEEMAQ